MRSWVLRGHWHGSHSSRAAARTCSGCPINGRDPIAQFIDAARHTLSFQNERYQDSVIWSGSSGRPAGVKVHVDGAPGRMH